MTLRLPSDLDLSFFLSVLFFCAVSVFCSYSIALMVVVFVLSVVLRIYFFHPKTLEWTVYGCLRVVGYIFFVLNFGERALSLIFM